VNYAGIDIGLVNGLVAVSDGPRPRLLHSEAVDGPALYDRAMVVFREHDVRVVGIERSVQVFAHGRGGVDPVARRSIEKALLASAPYLGFARLAAQHAGVIVYEAQAHETRKATGRIPKAPPGVKRDKWIDRVLAGRVPLLVAGWPARSTNHELDAAVAALWAQVKHRMRRAA
jgi:hypothetical protein